jgi:excisionase family DNA binding protein
MSTDLIPVGPELAVDVGGELEVGDPPRQKPKFDPEPDSDESPKPKRKERLARKAYSVDETAQIIHVSEATIWRLIAAKKLKTVKIWGRRLVPSESIDTLLTPVE